MHSGWQSEYSVGHPLLDAEHRHLLELCQHAVDCAADQTVQSRTQFHIILDELAKYGRRHFSTEESLLARCNYPLLEQQKTEHVAYEEKVTDFLLSATFGELDRAGVADFLQQWWREHILVDDMHYRDFVIEHRALLQ